MQALPELPRRYFFFWTNAMLATFMWNVALLIKRSIVPSTWVIQPTKHSAECLCRACNAKRQRKWTNGEEVGGSGRGEDEGDGRRGVERSERESGGSARWVKQSPGLAFIKGRTARLTQNQGTYHLQRAAETPDAKAACSQQERARSFSS